MKTKTSLTIRTTITTLATTAETKTRPIMNGFIKNVITLMVCTVSVSMNASSLSYQRYRYNTKELVAAGNSSLVNRSLPKKANRVSSTKGTIMLNYDESLPDSIKVSLETAKEIWESKLQNKHPVYIDMVFAPLQSKIAMETDIPYYINRRGYPSSLWSQIQDFSYGNPESPDGLVVFNSNIKWNCDLSGDESTGYNVATMALRGIAKCLGFGSDIKQISNNRFQYSNEKPSVFDDGLYFQDVKLTDLRQGSNEMKSFVTGDNVYYRTATNSYPIYAPSKYEPFKSLNYLKSDDSLMSHSLGEGNKYLTIDQSTIDILNSLGWGALSNGYKIISTDIGDDGIGSSYQSHTFSLSGTTSGITQYDWTFSLKNKTGRYTTISSGTSKDFTIDRIDNPQFYFVNLNGDLEGRIECRYTENGEEYDAIPFSVSLELKPTINSVDNIKITRNNNEFSVSLDVQYSGSDHISLEVEEEFTTSLRNYRFD